jgi:tetratricopeptide (TPR) repeat protein
VQPPPLPTGPSRGSLSVNTDWRELNAQGLALAAERRWEEAAEAFGHALAAIESGERQGGVTAVARDDIRARLLLNIGQCRFHTGDFAESRKLAERSYALRVALHGEDSLLVARTRGDLAVILAASGHTDEALSLLERAVSGVERKRGSESAHLLPLLNNAARLLARSAPERARPFVARLKALLFAQQQMENAELFPPSAVPAHSFQADAVESSSEDHYLRSAVAQTVDLLRATPPGNVALTDEAFAERAAERAALRAEAALAEAAKVEETNAEPQTIDEAIAEPVIADPVVVESAIDEQWMDAQTTDELPVADSPVEEAPVNDLTTDEFPVPELPVAADPTIGESPVNSPESIDDTIFDLVEPPPPTLSSIPDTAPAPKANPLGFEVEYGIPTELQEPLTEPQGALPPEPAVSPLTSAAAFDAALQQRPTRNGIRAVGGVRRGSAQLVAMNRLWLVVAGLAAFGGGVGAYFLYNYFTGLAR